MEITDEQLQKIDDVLEDEFNVGLERRLRAVFPQETAAMAVAKGDGTEVSRFLQSAVKRAESVGIGDDDDFTVFVAVMLNATRLAREAPALLASLRATLEMPDVSGAGKIAILLRDLRERAPADPHAARLCSNIDDLRAGLK